MVVFLVWGICIWDIADVGVFCFGYIVFGMLLMLVFFVSGICVWDVADVGVFRFGYLFLGHC